VAIEIKKVMETDEKGIPRQIYPETHINAIIGYDKNNVTQANQLFINSLPVADSSQTGLMSAKRVQQLDNLQSKLDSGDFEGKNALAINKVGEVEWKKN